MSWQLSWPWHRCWAWIFFVSHSVSLFLNEHRNISLKASDVLLLPCPHVSCVIKDRDRLEKQSLVMFSVYKALALLLLMLLRSESHLSVKRTQNSFPSISAWGNNAGWSTDGMSLQLHRHLSQREGTHSSIQWWWHLLGRLYFRKITTGERCTEVALKLQQIWSRYLQAYVYCILGI